MRIWSSLIGIILTSLFVASTALAQQSAAEIIEKARSDAKGFSELQQALNDPDVNVRLAVFNEMLNQENPVLKQKAIEAGITSSDNIIRQLTMRNVLLNLSQIHVHLSVDPNSTKKQQEKAANQIERGGATFSILINERDIANGTFSGSNSWVGQVSGNNITLSNTNYRSNSVSLALQDDNTLKGHAIIADTSYLAAINIL